jgi:hypothetical protein
MRIAKGALLGTAAAIVSLGSAGAADLPVKARPVEYMKICPLYGDGFYYIPGTDTCLKIGGYLRIQTEYNMGGGGGAEGNGTTEAPQARFARDVTNDLNYRVRAAMTWDVRQQTDYGTLRAYMRWGAENTTPLQTGGGTNFTGFWDRVFLQFAGFTVGKAVSFFDLFTYTPYSYHDPRVTGDTTTSNGVALWAYTAQFGAGVSASLSLEDPAAKATQVVDASLPGFFAVNGFIGQDSAFSQQNPTANGFRMPDIVVNGRVDQDWGYFGASGMIHDASGSYYGTPNNVNNGHPADKIGWAVGAGGQLNLPGGDMFGANVCYTEGSVGFCTRQVSAQVYNASTSVAAGWMADSIFTFGTEIELTRAWSALAAYQHIWNPRWRTSWFGGYAAVEYNSTATGILNSALVAGSVCARPFAGIVGNLSAVRADAGNSCNPNYSFYELGTRTQFNPDPQLEVGFEVLYTHHNTAYKGAALYTANAPRPAVTLMDDQNVWSGIVRWQRNFYP